MLNKKNEYVCIYKKDSNFKEIKTRKTYQLYRLSQSFIYECLQEPEHREYFHNMVQQQLEKKGLLLEIEKRDDVLVNTFKSLKSFKSNTTE